MVCVWTESGRDIFLGASVTLACWRMFGYDLRLEWLSA